MKLAQASIAVIGLTYSMDGGTDSTSIITSPGMVKVPELDCYYDETQCATRPSFPPEVVQNLAHSYGEITRGQIRCPYLNDNDIYSAPQNCSYFVNNATNEYALRYSEFHPGDHARAYPYLTKRVIRSSASNCYKYKVPTVGTMDTRDGAHETWIFHYTNGTSMALSPSRSPTLHTTRQHTSTMGLPFRKMQRPNGVDLGALRYMLSATTAPSRNAQTSCSNATFRSLM